MNSPFDFNMAGIQLKIKKDNSLEVVFVIKGSPADLAGIKKGDQISAINGEDARKLDSQIWKRLFQQEGEIVELEFKRENKTYRKKLLLKRLI